MGRKITSARQTKFKYRCEFKSELKYETHYNQRRIGIWIPYATKAQKNLVSRRKRREAQVESIARGPVSEQSKETHTIHGKDYE